MKNKKFNRYSRMLAVIGLTSIFTLTACNQTKKTENEQPKITNKRNANNVDTGNYTTEIQTNELNGKQAYWAENNTARNQTWATTPRTFGNSKVSITESTISTMTYYSFTGQDYVNYYAQDYDQSYIQIFKVAYANGYNGHFEADVEIFIRPLFTSKKGTFTTYLFTSVDTRYEKILNFATEYNNIVYTSSNQTAGKQIYNYIAGSEQAINYDKELVDENEIDLTGNVNIDIGLYGKDNIAGSITYYIYYTYLSNTSGSLTHISPRNAPFITNGWYSTATGITSTTDQFIVAGYRQVSYETEVIDIPSIMFEILTMPFTFISVAFNLTLFPGTPYQLNISALFLALLGILVFVFIFKTILRR